MHTLTFRLPTIMYTEEETDLQIEEFVDLSSRFMSVERLRSFSWQYLRIMCFQHCLQHFVESFNNIIPLSTKQVHINALLNSVSQKSLQYIDIYTFGIRFHPKQLAFIHVIHFISWCEFKRLQLWMEALMAVVFGVKMLCRLYLKQKIGWITMTFCCRKLPKHYMHRLLK